MKKVFFEISQNLQEAPVNFAKFLGTPFFTEQLRTTASEMRTLQNEAREIDCLCCREVDAMLTASCFGENPRMRGTHLAIQLLWASPPPISHTC